MIGQAQTDITILPSQKIVITELNKTTNLDSVDSLDYSMDTKQDFMAMYNATATRSPNQVIWSDRNSASTLAKENVGEKSRPPAYPSSHSFNNLSSSNFYYKDPITPIRSNYVQPGPLNLPSPGLSPIAAPKLSKGDAGQPSSAPPSRAGFLKRGNAIEEAYSSPVMSDEEVEVEYLNSLDNISLIKEPISENAAPAKDDVKSYLEDLIKGSYKDESAPSSPVSANPVQGRLFAEEEKVNQDKLFPGTPVRQASFSKAAMAASPSALSTPAAKASMPTPQKAHSFNDVSFTSTSLLPSTPLASLAERVRSVSADVVRGTPNNTSMKSLHSISYLPETPIAAPPSSSGTTAPVGVATAAAAAVSNKEPLPFQQPVRAADEEPPYVPPFSVTTPKRVERRTSKEDLKAVAAASPAVPAVLQTPLRGIMKHTTSAPSTPIVSSSSVAAPAAGPAPAGGLPLSSKLSAGSLVSSTATTVDMNINDVRERNRHLIDLTRMKYGNNNTSTEEADSPSVLTASWSPSKVSAGSNDSGSSDFRRAVEANTRVNSTPSKGFVVDQHYHPLNVVGNRKDRYAEGDNDSMFSYDTSVLEGPAHTPLKKTAAGSSISYYKAKMNKSQDEISFMSTLPEESVLQTQQMPHQQSHHLPSHHSYHPPPQHHYVHETPYSAPPRAAPSGLAVGATYTLTLAEDGSPVFVPVMTNQERDAHSVSFKEGSGTKQNNRYHHHSAANHDWDESYIDSGAPVATGVRNVRQSRPSDDSIISYGNTNPVMMSMLPPTPQSTGKMPQHYHQSTQGRRETPGLDGYIRRASSTSGPAGPPHYYNRAATMAAVTPALDQFRDATVDEWAFAAWKATVKATSDEYNYTSQRLESTLSIPLLHYHFPTSEAALSPSSYLRSTFPLPSASATLAWDKAAEPMPVTRANVYSRNVSASLFTPSKYRSYGGGSHSSVPTTPLTSHAGVGGYYSNPERGRKAGRWQTSSEPRDSGTDGETGSDSEYYKERLLQRDLTTVLKSPFMAKY